ncbi:hypothetical protein HID58_055998, partial [Brassica napus]
YFVSTDKPKRYTFSLSKKILKLFIFTSLYLQRSVMNSEIHSSIPVRVNHYHPSLRWGTARLGTSQAELKDGTTRAPIVRSLRNVGCHFQQIYEATNCPLYIGREKMAMYGSVNSEIHSSIPVRVNHYHPSLRWGVDRLTETARLGTSQAELKDGTTRAPIVRFLSCQPFLGESRSLRNVGCHFQQIYEATNCPLYFGREKMAMYGSVVTPVWCNGDGHGVHNVIEFLSDDSPDMDVIGISVIRTEIGNKVLKTSVSGLVELNILKNLTVYVVASSLGRFKSHAINIVNHRTFTISTITEDTIIENHGMEHSENILPSSEGDVGLAASSGPSVLGDKVDEECAAADPPEISDAQNNRKRCHE